MFASMRVAALYDVHGMLVPLEAVLAALEREQVDAIVLGGDVVAGAQPVETLERLRALPGRVLWVRGNVDREVAEPETAEWPPARWSGERLNESQRSFLANLPERQELHVDGLGRVLFCHATPRSDEEIVTPRTPVERLESILEGVSADVVVCGHTHIQDDRRVGAIRWVNAGSIGMPYESEVAAFWALVGPGVELRRTSFDVEAAVAAVRASGMPGAEEFATENLLAAADRDEAAAFFESRAE
jgi:putative phosphoesterase